MIDAWQSFDYFTCLSILMSIDDNSVRRRVAQFGSASGLGPEGRRFESCLSDQLFKKSA